MNTYLDCIPCFIKQTLKISERVIEDESTRKDVMRLVLSALVELDFQLSPPKMAQIIYRLISERSGVSDLYYQEKEEFNRVALELYPRLKSMVEQSANPWETSLRLAIAGNIIDLGTKGEVTQSEINESIDESIAQFLPAAEIKRLKDAVERADSIIYLGDNAGEIVFDKLFIKQMPLDKICYVVRGEPVINDATMKDARDVGLTEIVEVMDNGSDAPGTILEECSTEFVHRLNNADLIISKGQGNYETLSGIGRNICYLFKVKCPVVARQAQIDVGELVVLWKR